MPSLASTIGSSKDPESPARRAVATNWMESYAAEQWVYGCVRTAANYAGQTEQPVGEVSVAYPFEDGFSDSFESGTTAAWSASVAL